MAGVHESVAILTIFGFDKSQSNEIFSLRLAKKSDAANRRCTAPFSGQKTGKGTIVLKQSMGFPKEYPGINKILDGTDHGVQELKRTLTGEAKKTTIVEAMSPVTLFVS